MDIMDLASKGICAITRKYGKKVAKQGVAPVIEKVAPGVIAYPTQCREFDVWRLEPAPGRTVAVPGDGHARIAFVTRGEATFAGPETHALRRGEAVFIPAQDAALTLTGDAQVFLAAPGLA